MKNYEVSKLCIIGDLHFGVRNNSQQYLKFQSKWIKNELKSITKKTGCDSLFILGDVLDNRTSLSPVIIKEVRELFKDLVKQYKNVFVLLGNHDIYYRNTKDVHSLEFLADQGVTLFKDITEIKINDMKTLVLPWITKHDEEQMKELLVENQYKLCFGHLEINNFEMIKGIYEKDGISHSLFSNCERVFSGHFHLKRERGNIKYVGTPYELDWGDYNEEKGVYVFNFDKMEETFIPTKKAPIHIKINSELSSLAKITKKLINNNFIQLKFHEAITEVERIDFIEKINALDPLSFAIDEDGNFNFDSDEDAFLESSIKDTMGFLTEYIDLIDVPANLSKKEILTKLKDLHNKSI